MDKNIMLNKNSNFILNYMARHKIDLFIVGIILF